MSSTKSKSKPCLVIVESAAKAATIGKHLSALYPDRTWVVAACFGHIRDLPLKTLGVDPGSWDVTYENIASKKDVIAKLKKLCKDAQKVYLASDPDLEGYAIAHHLRVVLGLKPGKCERTTFREITLAALKDAFDAPTGWNDEKVSAQETRRILDRIVGYKASPLLWQAFRGSGNKGLSAGRVQSAALNMVIKRYTDFELHDPLKTWALHATFGPCFKTTESNCSDIDSLDTATTRLTSLMAVGAHANWDITFKIRKTRKSPPPPFTTSALQQEAYTTHRLNAKTTMILAQALYEEGFITYMRTDSTQLSNESIESLSMFIQSECGDTYKTSGTTRTVNPNAQEAHEAIRPTDLAVRGNVLVFKSHELTPAHIKLYDLIWRRTVASEMAAAKYDEITYIITHKEYTFIGKTSVLTFEGYMRVATPSIVPDNTLIQTWREIIQNTKTVTMQESGAIGSVSKPRLLYTETDLIKAMEKNGIGRPSTYVAIIDKLLTKEYVRKAAGPSKTVDIPSLKWCVGETQPTTEINTIVIGGTDKDRLVPQALGLQVIEYIQRHLPDLLNISFTATMESNLDLIEAGTRTKVDVLNEFYGPFKKAIDEAGGNAKVGTTAKVAKMDASFMKWRGIDVLSENDRIVLSRFPQEVIGANGKIAGYVMLGPYGVYLKMNKGKNKGLDKSLWPKISDNTLSYGDVI